MIALLLLSEYVIGDARERDMEPLLLIICGHVVAEDDHGSDHVVYNVSRRGTQYALHQLIDHVATLLEHVLPDCYFVHMNLREILLNNFGDILHRQILF